MDTKEKSRQGQKNKKTASGAASKTPGTKAPARKPSAAQQTKRPAQTRQTAQKKRASSAKSGKQPARARTATPDVVYTPGLSFSRNRFLLRLLTVVTIVIALTFGMSIFFRVKTVTVAGADKYTPWMIMEASGIQEGDSLLGISDARASGKITAALPYVKNARIGIKLPDTVNIVITEYDVVYSMRDGTNGWWLINSEGKIMEQVDAARAGDHTQVLGVQLKNPMTGNMAEAMETESTDSTEETGGLILPVQVVRASEQLSAALSILQYMESNGIVGEVVSVDVSNLTAIELWYGDRFQINLGDTTQLGYKVECMTKAVAQISQRGKYHSGLIDCSFTTWPSEVGYTPFE